MHDSARLQAAMEVLDDIHFRDLPADRVMAGFFKSRRFIGGKDKKAIADTVYGLIRRRGELAWYLEQQKARPSTRNLLLAWLRIGRGLNFRQITPLFGDHPHAAAPLSSSEELLLKNLRAVDTATLPRHVRLNVPAWLEDELEKSLGSELDDTLSEMTGEAPTDIRVNTLKTSREDLLKRLKRELREAGAKPTAISPVGLRFDARQALFALPSFKDGLFEVQDEGSQLLALLTGAKPKEFIIDLCAGAGGKTLAIAAQMNNKGRVLACDVVERKLEELKKRLRRAGVDTVMAHAIRDTRDPYLKRHRFKADRVLLDVPCSGSGTWRRNPDAKWRLTEARLRELNQTQAEILRGGAQLVREGGRLVYATCSILDRENGKQVDAFVRDNPQFKVVPMAQVWAEAGLPEPCPVTTSYLQLLPHLHNTDGFFVAVLEKTREKGKTDEPA